MEKIIRILVLLCMHLEHTLPTRIMFLAICNIFQAILYLYVTINNLESFNDMRCFTVLRSHHGSKDIVTIVNINQILPQHYNITYYHL